MLFHRQNNRLTPKKLNLSITMSIASIPSQKCAYPECTSLVPIEELQKCGICKHTFYCGTAHQAADLQQHKSERLLIKYEQTKDSTFFTDEVCPFGPLRVCIDIMIGTMMNVQFNDYIEGIIDNPDFKLYEIYKSSEASLAHRGYAAHVLHMRTLIRTNPSSLKGATFNISEERNTVKK